MAGRRFRGYTRPSPTRMLEWASNKADVGANVSANVVTRVVLLDGDVVPHGLKQTLYRIVGYLHLVSNQIGVNLLFNFGVYLEDQDTAGTAVAFDPATGADVAIDKWLWWSSRYTMLNNPQATTRDSFGHNEAANIRVDIKVKRIVGNNHRIILAYVGDQNYTAAHGLRILSKVTGTR